jgi:hypothetical protein
VSLSPNEWKVMGFGTCLGAMAIAFANIATVGPWLWYQIAAVTGLVGVAFFVVGRLQQ